MAVYPALFFLSFRTPTYDDGARRAGWMRRRGGLALREGIDSYQCAYEMDSMEIFVRDETIFS